MPTLWTYIRRQGTYKKQIHVQSMHYLLQMPTLWTYISRQGIQNLETVMEDQTIRALYSPVGVLKLLPIGAPYSTVRAQFTFSLCALSACGAISPSYVHSTCNKNCIYEAWTVPLSGGVLLQALDEMYRFSDDPAETSYQQRI